jgi:ketosteroid isomerase-like protein
MTASGRDADTVARLRAGYDAFNRGAYDEVFEHIDVDDRFEFNRVGGLGVVAGREAIRAWMEPDAIEEQVLEPREFRVNGDKVFVHGHTRGRGRASGVEVEVEAFTVWTVDDDGVFIRAENFLPNELNKALRAAGLEDAG